MLVPYMGLESPYSTQPVDNPIRTAILSLLLVLLIKEAIFLIIKIFLNKDK